MPPITPVLSDTVCHPTPPNYHARESRKDAPVVSRPASTNSLAGGPYQNPYDVHCPASIPSQNGDTSRPCSLPYTYNSINTCSTIYTRPTVYPGLTFGSHTTQFSTSYSICFWNSSNCSQVTQANFRYAVLRGQQDRVRGQVSALTQWSEGFQGEEEIRDIYLSIFISDPSFRLMDSRLKGENICDIFSDCIKTTFSMILLCYGLGDPNCVCHRFVRLVP